MAEQQLYQPYSAPVVQYDSSFFMTLPSDRRFKRTRYMEFRPSNPTPGAEKISIELPAHQTASIYDIQAAFLSMRMRICGENGEHLPLDSLVAPCNLALTSVFSGLKIYFNGVEVFSLGELFNFRAFMETTLSCNRDAKSKYSTVCA